jgi:hypothetical protein
MSEERAASVFILKMEAGQLKSSGSLSPTSQAERNAGNACITRAWGIPLALNSRHVAILAVRLRGEYPWLCHFVSE